MKSRLVILTEIISPYRIPLFNALACRPEVDLHVVFLSQTDPSLRQWRVCKDAIRFSYEVIPSWRKRFGHYNFLVNRRVGHALSQFSPDVILCGGYSYLASWQALFWARSRRVPLLLWSESNEQDARRGYSAVELLKALFLKRCAGFVVPGQSARQYLVMHGIRNELIHTAANAIDNDFFWAASTAARNDVARLRQQLRLPERYFLFVGRLVPEKGVFELLRAYAKLDERLRGIFGLVFVGDGSAKVALEKSAATVAPNGVTFTGFAQQDELPAYYALSEMLILPTYTDTWGLVVNEAMACGLPVIVSRAAGCANDLVEENWNGLLIPPRDEVVLGRTLERIALQDDLRSAMGLNSRKRISQYSPEGWANGMVDAITKTRGRV